MLTSQTLLTPGLWFEMPCVFLTQEYTSDGALVEQGYSVNYNTSHHINRKLTNGQNKVHLHGKLQNE